MKKSLLIILLLVGTQLLAQPLWMRHNVISPQGDKIAFCYKGDVYVVPTGGIYCFAGEFYCIAYWYQAEAV